MVLNQYWRKRNVRCTNVHLLDAGKMVWKHAKSKRQNSWSSSSRLLCCLIHYYFRGKSSQKCFWKFCCRSLSDYPLLHKVEQKNRKISTLTVCSAGKCWQAEHFWCLKRSPKFSIVVANNTGFEVLNEGSSLGNRRKEHFKNKKYLVGTRFVVSFRNRCTFSYYSSV